MTRRYTHILIFLLLATLATPAYSRFKVANYDMAKAKEIISERVSNGTLEIIEGIWESSNGKIYVIERFEDERFPENLRYRVIQLEGENAEPGMVDYFLEMTNYEEYYRIWGHNPFTQTNEPVGRETYIEFSPDSFVFKQQLQEIVFTRLFPQIDYPKSTDDISLGSGFAITPDGYIVTNHHVVKSSQHISICGVNGSFEHSYKARIVATDKPNDLAILKIEDPDFTTFGEIPYGIRRDEPIEGEYCFSISYPAITRLGINPKTTTGIISATTDNYYPSRCQTTVSIEEGSSGSPLFDKDGNVLAVNSAMYIDYYPKLAIKANHLWELIERCDELDGFSATPAPTGRQLTEIVATNKKFVVLVLVNYQPADEDRPRYILNETNDQDEEPTPFLDAKKLYHTGRYNEAVALLTQILTENPHNAGAYYLRGCCWEKLDARENALVDYHQALRSFDAKTDSKQLQASIYCNLSLCQMAFQDYEGAMASIEAALKIQSDDYTLMIKGLACYFLEKYDVALKILSDLIDNTQLQSTVYYYRALSHLAINEQAKALSDMQNAAACGNKSAAEWLNLYSSSPTTQP